MGGKFGKCVRTLTNVVNDRLSRSGVCVMQRSTAMWSSLGHPITWRPDSRGSCARVLWNTFSLRSSAHYAELSAFFPYDQVLTYSVRVVSVFWFRPTHFGNASTTFHDGKSRVIMVSPSKLVSFSDCALVSFALTRISCRRNFCWRAITRGGMMGQVQMKEIMLRHIWSASAQSFKNLGWYCERADFSNGTACISAPNG